MDKEYQRKSKWYQNHVANDKQEKEQKPNETPPKQPEEERIKLEELLKKESDKNAV